MSKMSFVSLINILLSNVEESEHTASQTDIDRMFGWGEWMKYIIMAGGEYKKFGIPKPLIEVALVEPSKEHASSV